MDAIEGLPCFVVDDDPDLRRLIAYSARRAGYEVIECGRLQEIEDALDRIDPRLIFLDVGLENCNATQVLDMLASRRCNAWIQLVSGRSEHELEALEDAGGELGLNMLTPLTKPFRGGVIRTISESVAAERWEARA